MRQTTQELDNARSRLQNADPPERIAARSRALEWLITSGIRKTALKQGDMVKNFSLPDAHGASVNLANLRERGPVVISFYRGGWCPYCSIELRALRRYLPEIAALGASLIAISPQLPDFSRSTEEENELTFPLLSDVGNHVAKQFGIVFELPPFLVETNKLAGLDLLIANGESGASQLPMPATFIVDSDGIIRLAFVDEDWTKRLDPEIIVENLRSFWEAD